MHSLVRKSDGTLVAWGSNGSGESTIPAGLSRVIAIAAGSLFSVALTNTPPVITSQPQSQVVRVGTNVSFSVTATGTGTMTYQWRKNGIAIANATNSTITFQAANRSFAGSYSAVVSIPTGVIVSSNALLRVLVAQRMERAEMLPGGTFKFRFGDGDGGVLTEADKNGFTLQWSTDLVQWFDLTNATCTVVNGMLELADPAAATQARRFYRVMEQ